MWNTRDDNSEEELKNAHFATDINPPEPQFSLICLDYSEFLFSATIFDQAIFESTTEHVSNHFSKTRGFCKWIILCIMANIYGKLIVFRFGVVFLHDCSAIRLLILPWLR